MRGLLRALALIALALPGPVAAAPADRPAPRTPPGKFLAPNYYVPRVFAAETVTVESGDGYKLSGDFIRRDRLPRRIPGILFLHDDGGNKREWYPLTVQTAGRGFAVLAMDLRGQGENPLVNSVKGKPKPGTEADFARMLDDVRQAMAWLRMQNGVFADSVGIIGMGLGSNLAIAAAAQDWGKDIKCVVALSPRLTDHGYSAGDALPAFGKRGFYIVVSKGDAESYADSLKLFELAKGPKEMLPVEGTARGKLLFGVGLMHRLPTWLSDNLPPGPMPGKRAPEGE